MTRSYQRSDFPLTPFDANGVELSVGDLVDVAAAPDVAFHGFNAVARTRYANLLGRALPITEFDENGYAVFRLWYRAKSDVTGSLAEPSGVSCFETHGFCFDPRDLARSSSTSER